MNIDGRKRREIREALLEAFPMPKDLRMVTDEVLNVPLQNVTGIGGDMETMAFDLISWTQARGHLTELVIGAATVNPTAPRLKALADQFQFASSAPGEVERINLKDVPFENVGQWLEKLSRLRHTVCRIEPQPSPDTSGYGTGFLVAPDVVMTNFHVIAPFISAGSDNVVVRFDYETAADGVAVGAGRASHLAADWQLADSPVEELDFALIRLAQRAAADAVPGGTRGTIGLSRKLPAAGSPLIILQHPEAKPLKMAIGSVVDPKVAPSRVSYTVNTEPGSSGSPCFNTGLDLVAIHHWGATPNRGVRLGAVLDFLKVREADLVALGLGGLVDQGASRPA
jgi:V8-like Glu-specific endopeptidase